MTSTPVQAPVDAVRAAATHRPAHRRRAVVGAVGLAGGLLSSAGLAGIMDAPDPHDPAAGMAAHFLDYRDEILAAAPVGYLGAAALAAFAVGLGRRVYRRGERTAGVVLAGSGGAVGLYFVFLHVVYTTLAYQVAASSPDATKALFVSTIMATPAFALAVTGLLASAAYGGYRTGVLPRWLSAAAALGAAVAAVGVFGHAETGYLYPDVQQQWVGNALLLWVDVAAVTLIVKGLRRPQHLT
jgi:hypothetical protein